MPCIGSFGLFLEKRVQAGERSRDTYNYHLPSYSYCLPSALYGSLIKFEVCKMLYMKLFSNNAFSSRYSGESEPGALRTHSIFGYHYSSEGCLVFCPVNYPTPRILQRSIIINHTFSIKLYDTRMHNELLQGHGGLWNCPVKFKASMAARPNVLQPVTICRKVALLNHTTRSFLCIALCGGTMTCIFTNIVNVTTKIAFHAP